MRAESLRRKIADQDWLAGWIADDRTNQALECPESFHNEEAR
jgi:hypothetical protein